MGLFDTLYCEAELPEVGVCANVDFQTKSLGSNMGEFIISKDGRLLEKLFDVLTSTDGVFPKQQFRDLHDTEFHGDLVFYGRVTSDGELTKYVARFTEGQLAWIRTLSTLPENLRQQILAKT